MLFQGLRRSKFVSYRHFFASTAINNRQFHASKPKHLVAEALETSHQLFLSVHNSTGLSWGVTITLVAFLSRIAYLPIQYYVLKQAHKRVMVSPLLVPWRQEYRVRALNVYPPGLRSTSPEQVAIAADQYAEVRLKEKRSELFHKFKIRSQWRTIPLSLGFLPIWIVNADVIRRMCGDNKTLLSYITEVPGKLTEIIPIQPEFELEAFMWLDGLAMPDPFYVLPVAWGILFSGHIAANSKGDITVRREQVALLPEGRTKKLRTIGLNMAELVPILPVLFAFLLIKGDAPSALVLYLLGSITAQAIMMPVLKRIIGYRRPLEAATMRQAINKPKPKPKV